MLAHLESMAGQVAYSALQFLFVWFGSSYSLRLSEGMRVSDAVTACSPSCQFVVGFPKTWAQD